MVYVAIYLICVIVVLAIWGSIAYKKNAEKENAGKVDDTVKAVNADDA